MVLPIRILSQSGRLFVPIRTMKLQVPGKLPQERRRSSANVEGPPIQPDPEVDRNFQTRIFGQDSQQFVKVGAIVDGLGKILFGLSPPGFCRCARADVQESLEGAEECDGVTPSPG